MFWEVHTPRALREINRISNNTARLTRARGNGTVGDTPTTIGKGTSPGTGKTECTEPTGCTGTTKGTTNGSEATNGFKQQ